MALPISILIYLAPTCQRSDLADEASLAAAGRAVHDERALPRAEQVLLHPEELVLPTHELLSLGASNVHVPFGN